MKTYKEKSVVHTVVDRRLCDRCGCEIEKDTGYHQHSFELMFASGDVYPEGDSRDGWMVEDCCGNCAEVLREAVKALGFKVEDYNGY